MSDALGIKASVMNDWPRAGANKSPALSPVKLPDWRSIAGLPPLTDTNITSPHVSQQSAQGALDRLLISLPHKGLAEGGHNRLSLDRLGSTDMQL
ncbi:pathogenicity island 2 effector protein SseC, partial [Yersinia enterocolitica]|nr:pathogenicity island 2 effector protein SseC [Yersinia enterocolitica]